MGVETAPPNFVSSIPSGSVNGVSDFPILRGNHAVFFTTDTHSGPFPKVREVRTSCSSFLVPHGSGEFRSHGLVDGASGEFSLTVWWQ